MLLDLVATTWGWFAGNHTFAGPNRMNAESQMSRGGLGRAVFITILVAAFATPASAHITLEQPEAAVGAPYKAVFLVPHGCGGSPTTRLRVRIPEGVVAVKPMAKPGWQIELVRGPYENPHSTLHGAKLTEGVKEVVWSGNLPSDFYDEFALSTFISSDLAVGRMLHFPVVQVCEKGEHRWIELPSPNKAGDHLGEPAPRVKLVPRNSRRRD